MSHAGPSWLQRIWRKPEAAIEPRAPADDIVPANAAGSPVHEQTGVPDVSSKATDEPAAYLGAASIDDIIRVEEVSDAEFFIGDLFRRRFHCNPPNYPRSFVAFYQPVRSRLEAVGFVHYLAHEDSYLCGGLLIDERRYRQMPPEHRKVIKDAGGISEKLLRTTFARLAAAPAIWGYVGDPLAEKVDLRAGFRHTEYQHIMVYWNKDLPEEEKKRRLAKVVALGPF